MTQNTSHAVMAQRVEPHDSLDDFPTPSWATRALLEHCGPFYPECTAWEPACNRGYMLRPLRERFAKVTATDIHDYGCGQDGVVDFLYPGSERFIPDGVDWIITNPPFRLAEQFYHRCRNIARIGFALLVRTQFLESIGRYNSIFAHCPPESIHQFTERVPMLKGRVDRHASTATAYCWIVRLAIPKCGTLFEWIPPCRAQLERDSDYEVAA